MKVAGNAPIYACVYAEMAEITRAHGYALTVHGSLNRDFDCICVPWTEEAAAPQTVVDALVANFSLKVVEPTGHMPHGRLVYTLAFAFGDVFIDLGFMPRKSEMSEEAKELQHQLATANEFIAILEHRLSLASKRLEHSDIELAHARVSRDALRTKLTALHDQLQSMGIDLTMEVKTKASTHEQENVDD